MTKRCSCGNKLPKTGCCFDCLKTPGKRCSTCRTRVCHDCYNHKEKLCNTCLVKKRAPATGRSACGKRPTDDAREPQSSSSGTLRGRTKAPEDTEIDNLSEVQVHVEKNQDDGSKRREEEVPDRAKRPKASDQKDPGTEITPRPSAGQPIAPDDQREQKEHTKMFIHQEEPAEEDPGTGESLINRDLLVQKQERSSNEGPGRSSAQQRASGQNSYPQNSAPAVVSKVDYFQETSATKQLYIQPMVSSTLEHTGQRSVTSSHQEQPAEVDPGTREVHPNWASPVQKQEKSSNEGPGKSSVQHRSGQNSYPQDSALAVVSNANNALPETNKMPPEVSKVDNVQDTRATEQKFQYQSIINSTSGHTPQSSVTSFQREKPNEVKPEIKDGTHQPVLPVLKSSAVSKKEWFLVGTASSKVTKPDHGLPKNMADILSPEVPKLVYVPPAAAQMDNFQKTLDTKQGIQHLSKVPNSGSHDKGSPEVKKVQGTLPEDSRMGSVQGNTGVKVSIPYQSIAIHVPRHSQETQGGQQKLPQDMTIKEIKAFLESRGKKVAKGDEKWALVEMVQKIQEQESRGRSAPEQRPTSGKLSDAGHNPVSTAQTEDQGKTANPEHQTTRPPEPQPQTPAVTKVHTQEETKGQSQEDQGHKKEVASKMSVVNSDPVSSTEPKDLMDTPSVQDSKDRKMDQSSEELTVADIREMTVRQLKDFLQKRGIHVIGGVEKSDLVQQVTEIERKGDNQGTGSKQLAQDAPSEVPALKEETQFRTQQDHSEEQSDVASSSADDEEIRSDSSSADDDEIRSESAEEDEREASEMVKPGLTKEGNPDRMEHENVEAANQGHTEPRDLTKIDSLSDIRSELEIDQLGVRQLKTLLQNHAVRQDGIQEKSEMVSKVKQLWHDIMKRIRRDIPPEDLCRMCMSEFIDCLLLECGHSVTCITCGRKIQECPMCRQYKSGVVHLFQLETEQGSDPVCLICKRNPRNSALLPCGHVATCYECSYAITLCPECQEYIRKPVRIYKS